MTIPILSSAKMDADFAADAGCWLPHDRVVGYSESFVGGSGGDSAWELIGQFVNNKVGASARIGVERSALRGTDYHKLVGALGVQELLDGSGLVSACGLVKSERELLYTGATCGDVTRIYDAALRPYGLTRASRIGYSIGIDSVAGPSLAPSNDTEIVANMTFHLQSAFYERGERYLLSDTVRVTENSAELMSNIPRILFERPA